MSARLFHLVTPHAEDAWRAAGGGTFAPPSLVRQGFVHLSFAHQLRGTLEVHYADESAMVLWEVAPDDLGAALRLEASRDDALFPHLYRALEQGEIRARWELSRRDGAWDLPLF